MGPHSMRSFYDLTSPLPPLFLSFIIHHLLSENWWSWEIAITDQMFWFWWSLFFFRGASVYCIATPGRDFWSSQQDICSKEEGGVWRVGKPRQAQDQDPSRQGPHPTWFSKSKQCINFGKERASFCVSCALAWFLIYRRQAPTGYDATLHLTDIRIIHQCKNISFLKSRDNC